MLNSGTPNRKLSYLALRISASYAVVASGWILLSDKLVAVLLSDPAVITRVSIYKGWAFVALTAVILHRMIRAYLVRATREALEAKATQDVLSERENLYRTIVNASPDAVTVTDLNGNVVFSSPRALEMFGHASAEEALGRNALEWIVPEERERGLAKMRRVIEQKCSFETEHTLLRKDGSRFCAEIKGAHYRSANEKTEGLILITRDITDRKKAEMAHMVLITAVEQAAEVILITDPKGVIVYANPAFETNTGYTRAEALGQNPRILKSGKSDPTFYEEMWKTLARGEVWKGRFINKRKNATEFEEEATISAVHDSAGKVVNYVAVKRDVTREVALENQLRHAQKMEAIGTLAGGVAHDFNNLLTIIQGHVTLAQMEDGAPLPLKESFEEIQRATERAAGLTRQLLTFSRRQTMRSRDLDVNEVVAGITKMLQRILGEDMSMHLTYAPHPLFTHADAGMMDQVLLNLAVNARDAMPKGGRLIIETSSIDFDESSATQIPDGRAGSFICLSVSDTGSGIPKEVLPRIFEPFFTTKDVGKGTGLGLATVYGIVHQHEGWITVCSDVGHGTTFRVYLPRNAGAPPEEERKTEVRMDALRGTETILLVEDEPALRDLVRTILSQLGYRILEAPSGVQALDVWEQNRAEIDLLLTDLVMPDGMTGMELAARLLEQSPKLKVIYTSGYSSEIAGRDVPLKPGMNFLAKPFNTQTLAETTRRALNEK